MFMLGQLLVADALLTILLVAVLALLLRSKPILKGLIQ